jgi:hypothetical protein
MSVLHSTARHSACSTLWCHTGTYLRPTLWLKAMLIQQSTQTDSDMRSIILRLGGFHTQMSYLGSIGHITADTGLHEILECVYAKNTISHMMTGKATSRAIRGHFLVSGVLNIMLMALVFGTLIHHTTATQDTGDQDEVLQNESNTC